VLFEATTGVPVRQAASLGELVALGALPSAPRLSERVSDVPAALDEAVTRCLEIDPAERPASAREVARLLGGDRPTAVLDTAVVPPTAPQRRHTSWSRARAVLALGALVALVVSLAWLAWPGDASPPPAQPPPAAPREQARDLTRWLEEHS
jgi:hypothetical protein